MVEFRLQGWLWPRCLWDSWAGLLAGGCAEPRPWPLGLAASWRSPALGSSGKTVHSCLLFFWEPPLLPLTPLVQPAWRHQATSHLGAPRAPGVGVITHKEVKPGSLPRSPGAWARGHLHPASEADGAARMNNQLPHRGLRANSQRQVRHQITSRGSEGQGDSKCPEGDDSARPLAEANTRPLLPLPGPVGPALVFLATGWEFF